MSVQRQRQHPQRQQQQQQRRARTAALRDQRNRRCQLWVATTTACGLLPAPMVSGQGTPCQPAGSTFWPDSVNDHDYMVVGTAAECQATCESIQGCAFFTFWPDGGCQFHPPGSFPTAACPSSDGCDQTISGAVDCDLVDDGGAIFETTTALRSSLLHADKCPGQFHVHGVGDVALIPTGWTGTAKDKKLKSVWVDEGDKVIAHMDGRGYFANICTGAYNHTQYLGVNLLGKKLSFMVDLSSAECGCNAAFYLTSMNLNTRKSDCFDYYCDANNVCGESCAEIDIMEANRHAFHATLHSKEDHGGKGAGFGGGTSWNGPRDFDKSQYGPDARCIDTNNPYKVEAEFPVSKTGYLSGMFIRLSQRGKDCQIAFKVDQYPQMDAIQEALAEGMTPILSYWGAKDMTWLDGAGTDQQGPCQNDDPKVCGDTVAMFDFKIESLDFVVDVHATTTQRPWTPPPTTLPPTTTTWAAPTTTYVEPPLVFAPAVPTLPPTTTSPWPTTTSTLTSTTVTTTTATSTTITTTTIPCAITRKADCRFARCCADPGMQCYEKHEYWAACQLDCTPGIDPRDPPEHNHTPWTCRPLGPRSAGDPIITTTTTTTTTTQAVVTGPPTTTLLPTTTTHPQLPCAATEVEDCRASECCHDAGMQCYEKHSTWSACLPTCTSSERDVWSCLTIGARTPGTPPTTTTTTRVVVVEAVQTTITATFTSTTTTPPPCSITRKADCSASKCCADPGMQCYQKNDNWAACQLSCTPGIDARDLPSYRTPWTCKELGPRTFGDPIITTTTTPNPATVTTSAPWQCALIGDSACTQRMNSLPDGYEYSDQGKTDPDLCGGCHCCRRPLTSVEDTTEIDLMKMAGFKKCSRTRKEDCTKTKCCSDPGMQCYRKNEYWAACELDCSPGIDPRDEGDFRSPWTCEKLGERTFGQPIITTTTLQAQQVEQQRKDEAKADDFFAEIDQIESEIRNPFMRKYRDETPEQPEVLHSKPGFLSGHILGLDGLPTVGACLVASSLTAVLVSGWLALARRRSTSSTNGPEVCALLQASGVELTSSDRTAAMLDDTA